MSDITVHIKETLDASTLQALEYDISQISGVDGVESHQKQPLMMVVKYDQEKTTSAVILSTFTNFGLKAELIGF